MYNDIQYVCAQDISLGDDVAQFASKSIRLEKCTLFRLDMLGRRVMAVRARVSLNLSDVMSPILTRAGISWDDVVVHVVHHFSASSRLINVFDAVVSES